MGLSSKKQTSKTSQNTTATTTPINPAFVTEGIEGLSKKIQDTFGNFLPENLVAGPTALQQQATSAAAGLGGGSALLRDVAGAGPTTVGSVDIGAGLDPFLKRYREEVGDPSYADFDFEAGRQRGQANLDLANDATFGGSSGALYKSALEGEIGRGRSALGVDLRTAGWDRAMQGAIQQAALDTQRNLANANFGESALNRRLQAGTALDANDRANVQAQFGLGEAERQIANEKAQAPIDLILQQVAAMSGLPLDLLRGSTSTGTMTGTTKSKSSGAGLGDWLNFFAANAQAAAGAGGG